MKRFANDLMCTAWMACIVIGFLLHGCGLYTAFAVDVAIGIAAFLIGTKKREPPLTRQALKNISGIKKG